MMPNVDRPPQPSAPSRLPLDASSQQAIRRAAALARRGGAEEVTPLHLLAALAGDPATRPQPHGAAGRRPRLGSALAGAIRAAGATARSAGADRIGVNDLMAAAVAAAEQPDGGDARAAGSATGTLGAHAYQGWPQDDPAVDRVLRTLARRAASLILLTAPPGALPGRVVTALARRLAAGPVPRPLRGGRVVALDDAPPVASLGHRAHAQLRSLSPAGSPVVAFAPNVLGLAEAPGGVDALLSAIRNGVWIIGTGEPEDAAALRRVPALRPLLRALAVEETSPETTTVILRAESARLERHHGVGVSPAAAEAAVWLSVRYLHDQVLPGKALELLEDACAWASVQDRSRVDAADVAAVAGGGKVVPGGLLRAQAHTVIDLDSRLRERVVGQDRAVAAVARAILRAETGVGDPDRPLGSFLFLGPTGVGKTELARTLAEALFGHESALVRLDMGEYQEPHAVARLVGSPPGYVGFEQGGHLSEALRQQPYSVVLLDEIEKAHPDVLNTLLAVLDEGRLTDGSGRTVDARHAVLIMTSNLGSRVILDQSLPDDVIQDRVRHAVVEHFPPEFHSRIDEVVVFRRLSVFDLEAIVGLHLQRLTKRLAARNLHFSADPDVRSWLAARAVDSPHGARPLRAAVRRHVEDVVARALVDQRLGPGDRLRLTVDDDEIALADATSW